MMLTWFSRFWDRLAGRTKSSRVQGTHESIEKPRKSQNDEVRACLLANLESRLDKYMLERNIARVRNRLIYERRLEGATQKIDLQLSFHPKEMPNAAAVLYPWFEVLVPEVDVIVDEMIDGNLGLLEGVTGARSRQPIEITSQKTADARWYIYQPDSVPSIVDDLRQFLERWTIPLLDAYATPEGIILADDRNDSRILRDRAQMMRVVAAILVHKGAKAAQARMERSFGTIGLRRRYQGVFDYLAARAVLH
jgi:hypothetical protein